LSFDGLLISVPPSQPARNWEAGVGESYV